MTNTAFLLFRIGMGVNMLFHAVNRYYYGAGNFSNWMVQEFEPTFLPAVSVRIFAAILPVLEGITGIMLVAGFKTRAGLVAGSAVMIALIAGSCLIGKWDWVTFQMVYLYCFYVMLQNVKDDVYSADTLLAK